MSVKCKKLHIMIAPPMLLLVAAAAASPPVFLQVTVINCTSPDDPANAFLQPLATYVNETGKTSNRITLTVPSTPSPWLQNNITGLDSNIVAVSKELAFVSGMDRPPGYRQGDRTVLATIRLTLPAARRRSTRAAPRGVARRGPLHEGVADLFYIDVRSILMVL